MLDCPKAVSSIFSCFAFCNDISSWNLLIDFVFIIFYNSLFNIYRITIYAYNCIANSCNCSILYFSCSLVSRLTANSVTEHKHSPTWQMLNESWFFFTYFSLHPSNERSIDSFEFLSWFSFALFFLYHFVGIDWVFHRFPFIFSLLNGSFMHSKLQLNISIKRIFWQNLFERKWKGNWFS